MKAVATTIPMPSRCQAKSKRAMLVHVHLCSPVPGRRRRLRMYLGAKNSRFQFTGLYSVSSRSESGCSLLLGALESFMFVGTPALELRTSTATKVGRGRRKHHKRDLRHGGSGPQGPAQPPTIVSDRHGAPFIAYHMYNSCQLSQ